MLAAALLAPAAAHGASAGEQIAALNAQREAHGIPAGIVEEPAWTHGCAQHQAYIAANGGTLTHEELPSNPGYTPEGAAVANRSVLTPLPEAFGPRGNAFESAPLHLMQTLAPALSRMGVAGGCATTSLGYDRQSATPALFSYPGNGTALPYAAETAMEKPFVPGDFAGLPHGATTGPYLFVMSLGTGPGQLSGVSLTGPAGLVDVRTVDNLTPGLVGYMPPGGMIIPVSPLTAGTTYRIDATFQPSGGAAIAHASSFTAGATSPPRALPAPKAASSTAPAPRATAALWLGELRRGRRTMTFTLAAGPALIGRRATITMQRIVRRCAGGVCRDRQRGRTLRSVIGRLYGRQTITSPRPAPGTIMRVRVQTEAFERGGVRYGASVAVSRVRR